MSSEIYLAAGCFWGAEHYLKQIRGVLFTQVGFANGHTERPSYREVYTDTTGYAETVRVEYDSQVLPLQLLLQLYFKSIDPVSVNHQGEDRGTRYRTGIYYTDAEDLPVIREVYRRIAAAFDEPLAVEVGPLENFYPAEDEHQDYLENHPDGYCHLPQALFAYARQANASPE